MSKRTAAARSSTPRKQPLMPTGHRDFPYKIAEDDPCCREFLRHGFTWGGHWKSLKDYQHFEKRR